VALRSMHVFTVFAPRAFVGGECSSTTGCSATAILGCNPRLRLRADTATGFSTSFIAQAVVAAVFAL